MISYLLLMTFLANKIQAEQHQWKKCLEYAEDYVENWTSSGHSLWEYVG